ncbi:hypothetical protein JW964_05570 [candidate division KSB1 bacterium]|nr:hypothetical protein [candidate division KSB1 bacterium]
MKNKSLVDEWLRRVNSNLERAKACKVTREILFEYLCFDCQKLPNRIGISEQSPSSRLRFNTVLRLMYMFASNIN